MVIESGDQKVISAKKRLEQKWSIPRKCPICKYGNFILSEKARTIDIFTTGGENTTEFQTKFLTAICDNCGHTLFFQTEIRN